MSKKIKNGLLLSLGMFAAMPTSTLGLTDTASIENVLNENKNQAGILTGPTSNFGFFPEMMNMARSTNSGLVPGNVYGDYFHPEIISMDIINKGPNASSGYFGTGDLAEIVVRIKTNGKIKDGMWTQIYAVFDTETDSADKQIIPVLRSSADSVPIKSNDGKIIAYNSDGMIHFTKEIENYSQGYIDVKFSGTFQGVRAVNESDKGVNKNINIVPYRQGYVYDKKKSIEVKADTGEGAAVYTFELYKDKGNLKGSLAVGYPIKQYSKGTGDYVIKIRLPEGMKFNSSQDYAKKQIQKEDNYLVGTNRKFYAVGIDKSDLDKKNINIKNDKEAEITIPVNDMNVTDILAGGMDIEFTDPSIIDQTNYHLKEGHNITYSLYKNGQEVVGDMTGNYFLRPNQDGFFEGTFKSDAERFENDNGGIRSKELEVIQNDPVNIMDGVINPPSGSVATHRIVKDVDTSTLGRKTGTIEFRFQDKSTLRVDVPVNVIKRKEADDYVPEVKENIDIIRGTTPTDKDAEDWVTNLPDGSSIKITKQPDTSTVGKTEAEVEITLKDGSTKKVTVPINVILSEASKYSPITKTLFVEKNDEIADQDVLDSILNKPSDSKIVVTKKPKTDKLGDFMAEVEITFKDGSVGQYQVPVKVTGNELDDFTIYTQTVIKQKGELLRNEDIVQAVLNRPKNRDTKVVIKDPLPSTSTVGEFYVSIDLVFDQGTDKEQSVSGRVKVRVIDNIDNLKARIEELEDQLKKCQEEAGCQNPDVDARVIEIIKQKDEIQKELDDIKQDLQNEKDKNEELEKKLKEAEDKNKELEDKIKDLQDKLAEEEKKNKELEDKIKDLEDKVKDKDKLEDKIKDLEKEKDSLQDDLNKAEDENRDLKDKIAEKDRKIKELEDLIAQKEKEISDLEDEIKKLNDEKDALEERIKELEKELQDEKNKSEINREKIRELESKLRDCKKAHLDKDKIIKELREKVIDLTSEVNKLKGQVNDLTRENNDLKDRYERTLRMLEDAKKKILELEKELLDKKYEDQNKEDLLKEIEKLKKQLEDKEREITDIYQDGHDRREDLEYDRDNRFRRDFDRTRRDRELRRSDAGYISDPPVYGNYDTQGIAGMLNSQTNSFESNVDAYIRNAIQNPVGTVINNNVISNDGYYTMLHYIFTIDSNVYTQLTNKSSLNIQMDTKPFIKDGRTMLPLRYVGYALGANVGWDDAAKTATFEKDGLSAKLTIGSKVIRLSDGRKITMDTIPVIRNDRMFVPLRYVYDVYNQSKDSIVWDGQARTVTIKIK